MVRTLGITVLAFVTSNIAIACTDAPDAPGASAALPGGTVVPRGKADDFFSTEAIEYVVRTRSFVQVGPGQSIEDAKRLVGYKHFAITYFLNLYLQDRLTADQRIEGYNAMAKGGRFEDLDFEDLGNGKFAFNFVQNLAGNRQLLASLPLQDGALTIAIGAPKTEELANLDALNGWFRRAPWANWNAWNEHSERSETLSFTIMPDRESSDAYWDLEKLLADDLLTVDFHFGWDYHDNLHIKGATQAYQHLKAQGFVETDPAWVPSTDDYRTELSRTLRYRGRETKLVARIFHGKLGSDTDPDTNVGGEALERQLRSSLATSDVVIYKGHSGPYYGFAMANWNKTSAGMISDAEVASAQLRDSYQIVFGGGCDTYMLGQAFRQNPHKRTKNINVVTTTSFGSALDPMELDFFDHITSRVGDDIAAAPISSFLRKTNAAAANHGLRSLIGVHGIDANPKINPTAALDLACTPCQTAAACVTNGSVSTLCVGLAPNATEGVCAPACIDDAGCPANYECLPTGLNGELFAHVCVPADLPCSLQQ